MLGFVQSWFAPSANPVGVDFGSDGLRLAQVELVGGASAAAAGGPQEFKLIAAARADVPSYVRGDSAARAEFFTQTVRELWSQGGFRGRRAVLALPAALMSIQHLRLPRMDDEALKKALPWEARGKLPYDPSRALLRHLVAGEIYQDGEQKNEVILMAANRDSVNQLLAAATKAKLDVVGMNVEPRALVDCFSHVYRRKSDADATCCFVDIGCIATRVVIARGGQILFARAVPIGGDHFTRAVASALKINADDARILRIKHCHAQAAQPGPGQPVLSEPAHRAGPLAEGADTERREPGLGAPAEEPQEAEAQAAPEEIARVEEASREPLAKLVEELKLCRHYHETTFPNLPVGRLVFVGGEARHRGLCQQIARAMELAAQLGDPLVRMGRISEVGIESGIDRRQPQPDWALAIGLSMGPVAPAAANSATANPAAAAPTPVAAAR